MSGSRGLYPRAQPNGDRGAIVSAAEQRPTRAGDGGLVVVLNFIHRKGCLLGKNARLVAVAIGSHMGARHEANPGVPKLMEETGLCKTAVVEALREVCGDRGPFHKKRGGPHVTNVYTIKPQLMPGKPDILKTGKSDFTPGQRFGNSDLRRPPDVRLSPPLMSGNPRTEQSLNRASADTPPTESPEAAERWAPVRDAVKKDGSSSVQAFAMSARAVDLRGNRLTLWVPNDVMARFLQAPAARAAAAFDLVVVVKPGRSSVAA